MRFNSAVGACSALLLATSASAFRDSSPLLVWSSHPNDMLAESAAEVNSGVINADTVFGSLASIGCDWDAVVVAHMDELHESHIQTMDLPLGGKAKADLHIPYLVRPVRDALDTAVESWARRCGADVVTGYDPSSEDRTLVYLNAKHGDLELPANLPKRHLVVLTGTRTIRAESTRDERPFQSYEAQELADDDDLKKKPKKNDTTPPGKDRYEYFTTPLLSCLFVSFVILLPILAMGLYALSGIQVPPRMMDINKSLAVSKGRKDQ